MALLGTLVPFWNAYEERGAGLNAGLDEHVCSGVSRFLFIESSRAPGRKALISVGTTGGGRSQTCFGMADTQRDKLPYRPATFELFAEDMYDARRHR